MKTSQLDLRELLAFKPHGGTMSFLDQRAYLTDMVSHGMLRKELLKTIGEEATRTIITRSGFIRGWLLAEQIKRKMPEVWSEARQGKLGPMICSMFGFGEVLTSQRTDGLSGSPLVETYFIGSYEADQELRLNGQSTDVACWEQVGFASGYVSNVQQRTVYFIEPECQAKGDCHCRLVGNYIDQWGDEALPLLQYYNGINNDNIKSEVQDILKIEEYFPRDSNINLSAKNNFSHSSYPISNSHPMQKLIEMAINVAKVPTSILVTGESGVGKEKLVDFIHRHSDRNNKPLLAINCGALTESLLDSELFGHVKGAFTGAENNKMGLIESANGGTLFLDEVGELSPSMQTKLLRVIQEKQIRRVGDNNIKDVDVRIISATNKDLEAAVEAGDFRQDLYYRLNVIELKIPPLRNRGEDILPLARCFLSDFNEKLGRKITGFNYKTADLLLNYDWPGNIRQLANTIERAVVLSPGPQIMPEDLPEEFHQNITKPSINNGIKPLNTIEKDYIVSVLETLNNNKALTAKKLGMSLATLYRKLKEYDELQNFD
ncbi:sigma-54-dependent Fis family transcriptional regulator [Shewanella sp. SG44-2]|jgi:two-component system response regulator HydG|uniref:sigma-54-dependent Fis family transcriptional regulator n=1 Tax=Shewanella sp. SG44-2 TaxID=2760962 RepID=UPI0016037A45|nr:sigma-54-dependent Fis family transcriptional regulator [Shewanella sp. SG44-2]MBB1425971.1 sigma-54-dependent Fis family transcriptional regulator [Shewanella sp. SG44-2]